MGLDILVCIDDVPNELLTQMVSSVEVYEKIDQNTSFKLTFMVDVCDKDIAKGLMREITPGKMLSILASVKDELACLVKGPIIQQDINIQHGGAGSYIHVVGEDIAHNMDHVTRFQPNDSVTDAEIVSAILTSKNNNMIADVEATPHSTHNEENHINVQKDSDLAVIRSLAHRNGFHFWITWSTAGLATGHFRPRIMDGKASADLIVNHDNFNMDSFRTNLNASPPNKTVGMQLNLRTKEIFGGTFTLDDNKLGKDGLASLTDEEGQSIHLAPMVDDIGPLRARSEAALREAQWFIKASCRTSLHRLCKIVSKHCIVNVQGAGSLHSGQYYVTGVKHLIDAASYIMELELERNAWGNEE